nr:DnaA initiator-associating protein DiaA [Rosenbergiella australiborealis]
MRLTKLGDGVQDRIKACFTESIQTQIAAAEALPDAISRATVVIVQCLLNGNKVLSCGNGASSANAQHFTATMINQFENERPSLPAFCLSADNIMLTAIGNERQHDEIYAKQVRALGQAGDILLAISTRGNSPDIVKAVEAAVTRDMTIVALTGFDGGVLAGLLGPQDVEIRIPSHRNARIQEMHMLTVNCLSELIDNSLFPHQEG